MTEIQNKRKEYLQSKHSDFSEDKVNFLVETGLTYDPEKIEDDNKKNWLTPKGAGFKTSDNGGEGGSETPTPDPQNPENNTEQEINNPDNDVTVTTTDDQGNTVTEPLDPNSSVEPIVDENGEQMGDSNGNVIIADDNNG